VKECVNTHAKVAEPPVAVVQITAAGMEEAILLPIATGIQGAASAIPTMIAVQTAEVQAAAPLATTAVVALPAAIAVVVHLATVIVAVLPAAVQVVLPMEDQVVVPALVAVPALPEVHAAAAALQTEDLLPPMADHRAQAPAAVQAAAPVAGQVQEGNLLLAEEQAAAAAVPAEVNPTPADKNKEGE